MGIARVWRRRVAVAGGTAVLAVGAMTAAVAAFPGDVVLDFDGPDGSVSTGGIYSPERAPDGVTFAWTAGRAEIRIPWIVRRVPLAVMVRLRAARPSPLPLPEAVLRVDGMELERWSVDNDFQTIRVVVPRDDGRRRGLILGLDVAPVFVPDGDPRELGVVLDWVEVRSTDTALPTLAALLLSAALASVLTLVLQVAGLTTWLAIGGGLLPVLVREAITFPAVGAALPEWPNLGPFALQSLLVVLLFSPCGFYAARAFFPDTRGAERLLLAPALGVAIIPLAWSLGGVAGLPVTPAWLFAVLIACTLAAIGLSRVLRAPVDATHRPPPIPRSHLKALFAVLILVHPLVLWFTGGAWVASDSDTMTNAFQATQIKIHGTYPVVPAPEWGPDAEVFIVYPPANIIFSAFVSSVSGNDTAIVYLANTGLFLALFSLVLFVIARRIVPGNPWAAVLAPIVVLPHGVLVNYIVGGNNLELHALVVGAVCILWLLGFLRRPRLAAIVPGAVLLASLYLIAPLFFVWIAYGVILFGAILPLRLRRVPWRQEAALVALLLLASALVVPWLLSLPRGPWRGGSVPVAAWSVFTEYGKYGSLRTCSPVFFALAAIGVFQAHRCRREAGWFLGGSLVLWLLLVQSTAWTDGIVDTIRVIFGDLADGLYLFLDSWLLFHLGFSLLLPILAILGLIWLSQRRPRAIAITATLAITLLLPWLEFDQPADGPQGSTLANYVDAASMRWFGREFADDDVMLVNLNNRPRYVANWAPVVSEKPAFCRRLQLDLMRARPRADWTSMHEIWTTMPNFADLATASFNGPIRPAGHFTNSRDYYEDRLQRVLAAAYRIDTPQAAYQLRVLGYTHLYIPSGLPGGIVSQDPEYVARALAAVEAGTLRLIYEKSNEDLRRERGLRIDIWPYHERPAYIFEILEPTGGI